MKFTWLVTYGLTILFLETIDPIEPLIGENVPQNQFFGFDLASTEFFEYENL